MGWWLQVQCCYLHRCSSQRDGGGDIVADAMLLSPPPLKYGGGIVSGAMLSSLTYYLALNHKFLNFEDQSSMIECFNFMVHTDIIYTNVRQVLHQSTDQRVVDKRFLLVLDDVWNENSEKWDKLKCIFTSSAMGSKVVATTRSKKVAAIMGATSTCHFKGLSNDDCWDLFKQRAFARGDKSHPNLLVTGKEIVKKCGGVPRAAKTLGSLMRFKMEESEWVLVKDNDIWRLHPKENDILLAFRLSYNHLPVYLKQCFAYCSMYPKGYKFKKTSLIQTWISQGFVHSSIKKEM